MLFCLAIGDQPSNLKLGIVMLDEGVAVGTASVAEWTHTLQQHGGVGVSTNGLARHVFKRRGQ
jgi:hypothetical protein